MAYDADGRRHLAQATGITLAGLSLSGAATASLNSGGAADVALGAVGFVGGAILFLTASRVPLWINLLIGALSAVTAPFSTVGFEIPAASSLVALSGVVAVVWAASFLRPAPLAMFVILRCGAVAVIIALQEPEGSTAIAGFFLAACAICAFMMVAIVDRLDERSLIDPLTGLGNRRRWAALANRFVNDRRDKALVIVLIDIDCFKQINDSYGHERGDAVLTGVADLVRELGTPDVHGIRWGGDEFLLACTSSALADVESFMLGLVAAAHERLDVSLSYGTAARLSGESLDEAVARADARLYEAKRKRSLPGEFESVGPAPVSPTRH